AMKSARRPTSYGTYTGMPPVDAKGWPATDASVVAWQGIANMHGTYRLSFTGQAIVTTSWGAATLSDYAYDPATNTTTATVEYHPTDWSGLLLNFASTRRTPTSEPNTGITDIKLMRPLAPGSAASYEPGVTFTQPIKDMVSKFSVVRMMDLTGSNGWKNLNGNWDLRRPADYASQAAVGAAPGMAWEYAVQFWNETDTDAWVNVPFPADDAYVTNLATLLKNTLEPGRKVYVEYSNELWNPGGRYPGEANRLAALAEVQANPASPLNFDGIYPANDPTGWELSRRRVALRGAQVSDLFRTVFGEPEMMTRVRPIMGSQFGWTAGWLARQLDYMEDYFNNPTYRETSRPPSYYFYGAGGTAYQEPDWALGAGMTVDQVFDAMPHRYTQYLSADMDWVAAFGLKRIAYEGGPNLDNYHAHTEVPSAVLQSAWSDPRMRAEVVANHDTWSAAGGDLLMYFSSTGSYHWGLTADAFDLNTPKLSGIDDLKAAAAAPVNWGRAAPVDLLPADFTVPVAGATLVGMQADSLTKNWTGATFRVDAAGPFAIRLTTTFSYGGRAEVFVDGKSVGTIDVPVAAGATVTLQAGELAAGVHGVVIRARAGTFGLTQVSVRPGTGATLFSDTFDTGATAWTPSGPWAVAPAAGRDTTYAATRNGSQQITYAGDVAWSDYSVSAWVNLANAAGGLSLLGRVVDATHYYLLEIKPTATGMVNWFVTKRDGAVWTALANGRFADPPGTWLNLRLTMTGSSMKGEMSVDGSTFTTLGTATDTAFASGRIGLRVWGSVAYFDDVLVKAT
ncbi:MAG TPA: hypothetical protein VM597_31505, partial [Gemmataceae bacterium]|nr:hypothetical protein [Gemmataceae bacterium]